MAGEPKRRHSKARKKTKKASIKLAVNFVTCKNCGKLTKSHTVCKECGFFGGKEVTSKKSVKVTTAS